MKLPLVRCSRQSGFTLIELLVVLAIVALLLSLAAPRYVARLDHARDVALADNLATLRLCIDHFYDDTGRYPDSLEQLVQRRYLRAIPVDPVTGSEGSWIVEAPEDTEAGAVYSVKSGAPGNDRSGKPYAQY
jgi:general secretion pathway protein G